MSSVDHRLAATGSTRAAARSKASPSTAARGRHAARFRAGVAWSVRRTRLAWWRELLILVALYGAYTAGRLLASADVRAAQRRADVIALLERHLHLAFEHSLNAALTSHVVLEVVAAYWYSVAHYAITPVVLLWLWRRHRHEYPRLRTTLALATGTALAIYLALPTAPPRLLPGFTDTLARTSWAGWWSSHASAPRGLGATTNELAAMPSMHVGWAVWVALCVVIVTHTRLKHLAWLYPAATATDVIATGNHWVSDVFAGALIVLVSYGLTTAFEHHHRAKPHRGTRQARRPRLSISHRLAVHPTRVHRQRRQSP